jgi:hypothetical protein
MLNIEQPAREAAIQNTKMAGAGVLQHASVTYKTV